MTRRALLSLATLALAATSACSARDTASPTLTVPPAAEASATAAPATPTPAGDQSERGNVIKQLGQTASFGPLNGDHTEVTFAIDTIAVDAKCTNQYANKPENGHFLRLDLRAETKPTMSPEVGFTLSPSLFTAVGPDGITEQSLWTPAAATCLEQAEQFPFNLNPGSKYRGSMVLDTRNPSGVLVLRPGAGGVGWEWTYGG